MQILPFYEVLDINKEFSIKGNTYKVGSITTLSGLLTGVRIITLTPRKSNAKRIRFTAWPHTSGNCIIYRMVEI